jgi:hypothetical protein
MTALMKNRVDPSVHVGLNPNALGAPAFITGAYDGISYLESGF